MNYPVHCVVGVLADVGGHHLDAAVFEQFDLFVLAAVFADTADENQDFQLSEFVELLVYAGGVLY